MEETKERKERHTTGELWRRRVERREQEETEKEREREREKGADGRSTNMVDRPWMSGAAHGVTHAPHRAIRARASSLIK